MKLDDFLDITDSIKEKVDTDDFSKSITYVIKFQKLFKALEDLPN